ncbi:MAG: LPS export ABC transporter permease LptG [Desulfuromonadales bacterium GWD2_61_12]|nr:MAG: LPS export ABC transporter permease LptG [Desulfuromonadales bacterium GWC2_61_20]OGR33218.1 MAG: LPS export ABC transporter permease LptG [Desulfuromonadales bacterium GWD2_61_12]
MTILNRYLLAAFLRLFTLALSAFVGIYLLIDFFEKVDDFIEHQASVTLYLAYFASKTPLIVCQVVPLAVLLAVFMTLGGFSRTSELTAMRAGGVSLLRITLPLLSLCFALSLLVLAANEYLVPVSVRESNRLLQGELLGKATQAAKLDRLWFREQGTIVNIRLALPEQDALQGLTLYKLDSNAQLVTRTDGERATFAAGGWNMNGVTVHHFDALTGEVSWVEHPATLPLVIDKTPADFRTTTESNEEIGISQLRSLAHRVKAEGYDPTRYLVDLHGRTATPFASFIMAFLGIPFALQRGRGSNLALGIAISVAIGITYHILQGILIALGYSGVLPPLVAAWAPNLLFGLIGVWMMLMTRQ